MKHAAAVLLLALANKEINEKNLNEIFASVGIKPNPNCVKALIEACKGKKCDQLVKEGLTKLGGLSFGGPAAAGSTAPAGDHAEAKKDDKKGAKADDKKKEKPKEKPKEEEEDDMGFGGLF